MSDDPELMPVHLEVRIRGDQDVVRRALESAQATSGRWVLDTSPREPDPIIGEMIYFKRLDDFGEADRLLWMAWREDPGEWYISNVIPAQSHESPEIDRAEYNRCVAELVDQLVPYLPEGAELIRDPSARPIEGFLSERVADQLRAFSSSANKTTGIGHPNDRERWLDFVIGAHNGNEDSDAHMLHRWLLEVGGWGNEWAEKLALYYEYGRDLLARYDHRTDFA